MLCTLLHLRIPFSGIFSTLVATLKTSNMTLHVSCRYYVPNHVISEYCKKREYHGPVWPADVNIHLFSIFSYTWFDTKSKPKFSTIWNFLIWFLLNSCHPFEVLKNYLVQQCNTIMPADILMFEGKKWKIAQIVSPQIPISSILPYSPKKSW